MADSPGQPTSPTASLPWRFDSLGAALRELRRGRGLSLRAIAPELTVSFAELSRIERGQKPVTEPVAQAAERFFSAELHARDAVGSLLAGVRATAPGTERRSTSKLPDALAGPRPPRLLLGREEEQAYLVANLGGGRICTVDGLPGIGASALVAATAYQLGATYRAGGVLRGELDDDTAPDSAYPLLTRWLSSLGVEDIPAGMAERAAALSRALPGPPGLIIVENAADSAQLRPLLPLVSQGYDLVVTSHRRLPTLTLSAGAKPLTLRPLAAATGARLLRALDYEGQLDEVSDSLLAAISRFCGGLPAAMHTVSALLRHHEELSAAQLHDILADPSQRLDLLSDVTDDHIGLRRKLTSSYGALSPDARWLFRILGLHGGQTVTLRGAAALAGQTTDTVHRGLNLLADAHLLEPTQPDRWVWHDLPLLLAGELVRRHEDPYQRIHAVRRWVHWLIRVATDAANTAADAEHHDSHAILDAETLNLAAASAAAAHHGQTGLIRQLISLLDQAGRPDLAERCEPADTRTSTAMNWPNRPDSATSAPVASPRRRPGRSPS